MAIARILALLGKEFRQSVKSFVLFQAVLTPVLSSLLVFLIFGQLFIGQPRVGILEDESSKIAEYFAEDNRIVQMSSEDEMIRKVTAGKIDIGLIFPTNSIQNESNLAKIKIYFWGGCSITKRDQLISSFHKVMIRLAGKDNFVHVKPEVLGDLKSRSWYVRLLPLIVLLSIMMAGLLLPSTALVDEKEKDTLTALLVTPINLWEIQIAKTLYGVIISFLTGLIILLINRAMGPDPVMLIVVLLLAALTAATLGSIFGYFSDKLISVLNLIKSVMIVFYAPAILNIFPQIPDWIQKIFPTYYIFSPILKMAEGTYKAVNDLWEIGVLAVIFIALFSVLTILLTRTRKQLAA